jgi:hypothetical protein
MPDDLAPLPKAVEGEYLEADQGGPLFRRPRLMKTAATTKHHVWNYDFYSGAATCARCGYVRYSLNAATPACR